MHLPFNSGLLLALFLGASEAQNCPFLGPAYPPATNVQAPAFVSAKAAFDKGLADALASGKISEASTSYAIQVYLGSSKTPIHAAYHTPTASNGTSITTVGPDTVFRAHSISKLITVYTILTKLEDKYWDEPLSKYLPEFSHLSGGNPAYDADWEVITLGSLASLMSGIGRDYALNDLSVTGNVSSQLSGVRPLLDFEKIKCGAAGLRACTRAGTSLIPFQSPLLTRPLAEALQSVLTVYPFSSAFNTPNYSNMAFQLLAYAVENITDTPFPDLVRKQLLEPLNLRNTFLTLPSNLTINAVKLPGWDQDFGDEAPSAGYYLSATDLTTLGTSILSSSLLSPAATRKWLKPLTHTSSLLTSLGRPWEILRTHTPISSTSTTTRVVDVYTKQGGGATYTSLLALSPAHNLGISILTAGTPGGSDFDTIKALALDTFLAAAEQAARDAAGLAYAGNYTMSTTSTLELGLHPDEPGLFLRTLISNGTDMLALAKRLGNFAGSGQLGAWFYPMGLVGRAFSGTEVPFRGKFGLVGVPAGDDCASWATVDQWRYGGYPADLAVFGVGGQGQVSSVQLPFLSERIFRRSGNAAGDGVFGPFEPGE
ncbi:beta-lactamase/transpeptidase-like protein [Podospora aff. communis PSN243]|uniref:Beta-lactamase/transpeptidase-like protein n=1 Tax=Podospora aff. communis PSN243 TaxID=3040156 RepID=A0AAV9GEE2_9PEZI|nr:beta-lactamase/transpeptidase-like protein [Podospora aff. communis PSN243]